MLVNASLSVAFILLISLFILIFKDHKPCLPNNFIGEVEKESSQNELNKLSKMVQMNTEKATIK